MSMKMKMKYVAPEVEIVETLVEVGFAGSAGEGLETPDSGQSPAGPF